MLRPAVGSHRAYSGVKGNQSVKQQHTSFDSNKLWQISRGHSLLYVQLTRGSGVSTLLSMRCIKLLSNLESPPLSAI